MAENTRYDAVQNFLEQLKPAASILQDADEIIAIHELFSKFRRLGDVRVVSLTLQKVLNLLRTIRSQRPLPTLAELDKRRDLLAKMRESIKKLRDIDGLREQLALLQEIEPALYGNGDISGSLRRLWIEDLSARLDALGELQQSLTEWERRGLSPTV